MTSCTCKHTYSAHAPDHCGASCLVSDCACTCINCPVDCVESALQSIPLDQFVQFVQFIQWAQQCEKGQI
jgi:hypothetical protein